MREVRDEPRRGMHSLNHDGKRKARNVINWARLKCGTEGESEVKEFRVE